MNALIVDGYNAIYKITELQTLLDKSLLEARREVTRLAKDYQRKTGGIAEVYVVFDGKDDYRGSPHPPLANQIFSKTGEGDEAIIKTVEKLSGRYHCIVASDDNFVRNNARAYRATVISIAEFSAGAKKKKTAKRSDASDEKRIDPKSAREITDYFKRHL